ncbi:hypothetical protein LX64_00719 [Chitinophaga skermanii]|uniref:Uncharacterized protein n=1 Tax=Chitinophaga skermanii TaxID=331697 RepID=A0A327R385_9BACT|nr:hypothetical protein [Chitinophaga skermanii]RAJ11111.1 hypothetical protein LX64_00719 [Chitinophaga skermanii]
MHIDPNTGNFTITNNVIISPSLMRSTFLEMVEGLGFENWTSSDRYTSYLLRNFEQGEWNIIIWFADEQVTHASISPGSKYTFEPWAMSPEEKTCVKAQLKALGGAMKKSWGSLSYNEDIKSGFVDIVLLYRSPTVPAPIKKLFEQSESTSGTLHKLVGKIWKRR